jgi:cyclopropane-fatty-acyl-phospholipid synthase
MTRLEPNYEQVQAHYDLSNEFFALFLDPTMTYSCAYFAHPRMTLEEAQQAKIDLSLGKCALQPGQRLLDIGCGWGSTVRRAAEHYGVEAVGLTLSRNQQGYAADMLSRAPPMADRAEVRLQGWEEFDEPVDRIVSIGAFEHFRAARYGEFFARCRRLLPADGRMLLHTIVLEDAQTLRARGIPVEHEHVLFAKFIRKHIFPGGQLCPPDRIVRHAEQAGFRVVVTQSLQQDYALTLDCWAANLRSARREAVALKSAETYDLYLRYLTGCADHFRSGHLDVVQFTLCVE